MNTRTTQRIQLSAIGTANRLRPVDEEEVERIKVSFEQVGQITPIEVAPADLLGAYSLIAGAHRLEAARRLGWLEIDAVVFEGTPDEARLREIDENLYRHELNPLDEAVFLAERKAIYERLHPEAKRGGDRRSDQMAKLAIRSGAKSFADDVAEKAGLAARSVRRALQRFDGLAPECRDRIRGTWLAKKGAALDALLAVPREKQLAVASALLDADPEDPARPRTVADARRIVLREKPAPTDLLKRAQSAFNHLSVEDQRRFIDWLVENGHLLSGRVRSAA